ncbi:replication initiation protein [Flammeovirga kamogawensis]|uniref:Replication initiation protein n=1 Tax=Flammeovirga kamogawensis TaxID=373891 RepID=A0ABX8H1G7_9BACT|nr:replication initiation protein [Flammeovirga kamogawensis]MBB6462175.1 plasmid replication initiation protein [Flammeovirga kamogawensis]QWG09422.1 replication initiation protein [Flammeovirga kamogawensis]TRX64940.1 replication initiation protein [Flammeovirga kamogawensis]
MDILNKIRTSSNKVKRSNRFIKAKQKKPLPLVSQKLLLFAFTLNDLTVEDEIEFKVSEFLGRHPGGKDLKQLDFGCDALSSAKITLGEGDHDSKTFDREYIPLFSKIKLDKTSIKFQFNGNFKNILSPSSNYTQYLYSSVRHMRSPHAVRMYDLLSQGVGKYNSRKISVEELKSILGLSESKSYKSFAAFNRSILQKCLKDINENTDLEVNLELIKTGRRCTHLEFFFKKKEKEQPKTIEIGQTANQPANNTAQEPQQNSLQQKMKMLQSLGFSREEILRELLKTDVEVGGNEQEDTIDVDPVTVTEQPTQQTVTTPRTASQGSLDFDFQEKVNKLHLRLNEIGLTADIVSIAIKKYQSDPNWKIWPELNNVKMAMRDGASYPNKHTLKKWIIDQK